MVQPLDDARRRRLSGGSGGSRVPPHNLEAEESLLGAMLLSRDAIVSAVEVQLTAGDFYKPAHGHVYEAISSIYAQGEPADPVTVAEELRRAGLLDMVGGTPALVGLQANTPAIGNAARYARIVEEHALLRKLIGVAGDIAEMGYSVPDDVTSAIDEAEALIFDVAQRRVTDTLAPLRDLLERHLDHIEALYERGDDITGVPTGYIDLDQQLAGLQPSNLVIVGGRPGTGKALAVDTPVPTPAGWTTMGDLRAGDTVLDLHGRPCTVTFATPVMHGRPCFEVVFDDGAALVADSDHQWLAAPTGGPARVVTTADMVGEGVVTADGRPRWHVPLAHPLDLPEADLPVDPYVLGCWLGDAGQWGEMRVGEADWRHFHGEFTTAGYAFQWRAFQWRPRPSPAGDAPPLGFAWAGRPGTPVRVLTTELRSAGLAPTRPKRVPAAYLRASAKQRLALLQGLCDRAAQVAPPGAAELRLPDAALVHQARELACSLGHKPGPVRGRRVRRADGTVAASWGFRWSPLDPVFRLPRKADRLRLPPPGSGPASRAVVAVRPVPPVPVRCITVDAPSAVYLAGESLVPTHNTSFALGIVAHAALESRTPVLMFSLEMSHLELTQRLLCAEARVDATRMRNGRLLESDWPKISHAVGRLAEAPVFIDDNPRLTVMEIRAKARRLKSRAGLGLIVIDYLQLMTGRTNAENRQVEVSEISRGLKILARELQVPVVALSQLSRGLETRADKRPVLADLRESGCMPATTRVLRADNGEDVTIGELVLSQERPLLWSVDEHRRLVAVRLEKAFPSGVKPVFRMRLASGRSVEATANHPFLTPAGWARLDSLGAGSLVAVPGRLPPPVEAGDGWADDELVLLAQLLGGGAMGPSFTYATADRASKDAVEAAARRLFGIEPVATTAGPGWSVRFPSPYPLTRQAHHPIRNWLEPHGLWGSRPGDRFVPRPVFGLADRQVALFLRHLWASAGSITISRQGREPLVIASYPTASERLALDVQRLLLRLRIRTAIGRSKRRASPGGGGGPQYREVSDVRVQGTASLSRFLGVVGCHGGGGSRVPEALAALGPIDDGAGVGPSDLDWDAVVEITPLGEQPTFDLTVPGTHNFVADGIVAHNSLEQDADVVIFLYRDEVYNRDSPDRGTAEVLVAKHRNGPTGMTQLAFLDHYTRFANMAKGV